MKLALVTVAMLVASCTHIGEKPFTGPDGTTWHEAYCRGRHATFADCMNVAAETCGGKYEVMDRDKEVSGAVTTYASGVAVTNVKTSRTLIFRCKRPVYNPGPAEPFPKSNAGEQCIANEDCAPALTCRGGACRD